MEPLTKQQKIRFFVRGRMREHHLLVKSNNKHHYAVMFILKHWAEGSVQDVEDILKQIYPHIWQMFGFARSYYMSYWDEDISDNELFEKLWEQFM